MPVRIRLARHGRKSRPYYYIVVADSRAPRDGKFIERIGSYNPVTNPATVELDFDKALDWLQKGAQPSDTARTLLQQKGVMYKNHLLKGVRKGALTEEQAEHKFQDWINEKDNQLSSFVQKLEADERSAEKSRLAAEIKVRESMAAELAKKRSDLVAAEAVTEKQEPEAVEEAAPEVVEEAAPEVVEEAAPEVVVEAAPELVEEAAPEVVEEAAPEVVVEAAPEVVEEAPAEEAVEEEKSGEEKPEE